MIRGALGGKAEDVALVAAKAHAQALTIDTAPVIYQAQVRAQDKAQWLKVEVDNSGKRIEDAIKEVENTTDADERAKISERITSELKTLDGWLNPRPVDPARVAAVILRDRKNAGMK
jgi:hypothetical protein